MQSKPKANSVITTTRLPNGHIQFTVIGCEPFTIDPDAVPEAKAKRARDHGIIQRVADGGALGRDKDTGKPATPEAKRARMWAIAQNLLDPTTPWEMRAAAPTSPKPSEILLAAVAEARGEELDDAFRAKVDAQATKRGLTVVKFLDAIRAQSATVREIEARMVAATAPEVDVDGDWDAE